jgi:hypothetical protein
VVIEKIYSLVSIFIIGKTNQMKKLKRASILTLILIGGAWLYQITFDESLFDANWKVILWAISVGFLLEYTLPWVMTMVNSATKTRE